MIKVMVVDDQRLIRDGLKIMIELEEDLNWVGEASNGREAFERAQQIQPDVVIMDIRMADSDGVEGTRLIKQWNPDIKVLILTTFDDDEFVIEALKEGGNGYILKDIPANELLEAVRTLMKGGAVMPPDITAKLIKHIQDQASASTILEPDRKFEAIWNEDGLTVREREIVTLIGEGYSNRELAVQLFISEGTVKNHVSNIMQKLHMRERTHIAIYAITGQRPRV
jgi:DNA-binding NarL/FixJ family response regulator